MESTKTRILKKMLETDGYLSGQELCEQLGVSRTAVWKYMKQLKEEGYEIEAVQNKGYCLKDVPGSGTYGLPEAIAILFIAVLHKWKKNTLLSIGGGTVLYMFLVQMVF